MGEQYRIEKDSLGEFKVPRDAWYGNQTARAVLNFPICGRGPDRDFVLAHVLIKRAAAVANQQAGWLDETLCNAIVTDCDRILSGDYIDQFVVDRFQAAAGTGLNTAPNYAVNAAAELARRSGAAIRPAADLAAQMQSTTDIQRVSSAIRDLTLEIIRIANDMRLLASGPRTGIGEILLPAVQPGSSIMPGKVNPVMFEMLNQVCFQVLGQDSAIAHMTQAGQLELNVMMPAMGSALFDAMDWLTNGINAATEFNLRGLKVERERCKEFLHISCGLATLLNTELGYSAAPRIWQTGGMCRRVR